MKTGGKMPDALVRVTAASPCPICGKDSWCSVSPDGETIACSRVADGAYKTVDTSAGAPSYLHRRTSRPQLPDVLPAAAADPMFRNEVYRALLQDLPLSESHRADLRKRGLSDSDIDRGWYRSHGGQGRGRKAVAMLQRFGDRIFGVPGFVVRDGDGGKYPTIAGASGMLIPARDIEGRIVGLKVRADDFVGGARYTYVSSVKYGGPGPGAAVHVPVGIEGPVDVVRLTEGEIKADVATRLNCVPTVSIPGVANWAPAVSVLRELGAKTVRIAFDADSQEKREVAVALSACAAELRRQGFEVELEIWPAESGKGIDDVLASGNATEVLTGVAAAAEIQRRLEATRGAGPEVSPREAASDFVANFTMNGDGKSPLSMPQILENLERLTEGWPRRVGPALFVHERGGAVHWLSNPPAVFGWIGSRTGKPPRFADSAGYHGRAEVFSELQRKSTEYLAIETLPHEPPIAGHYYACETPDPGDGEHLRELVSRFNPETPIDSDLITALFATSVWGGPGGTRPAFVVTSDDGRGSGKTALSSMCGHLAGGMIELSPAEDGAAVKQRLLSPDGMKRIVRLDNIKTLRFSSPEFESLITSPVISGKRMYIGEGQRPNTLVWIVTLNGVSLATDMAQRSVIIKIKRPTHSGAWEEDTRRYIDEHRSKIIGDIRGFLLGPQQELARYTRWGAWERDVLSKLPDPGEAQCVILERQGTSDVEEEEGDIVVEFFRQQLTRLRYDVDRERIFIPSQISARWFNEATNDRHSVTAASRIMKQKITEGRMPRLVVCKSNAAGRGFAWVGDEAMPELVMRKDVEARLSDLSQNGFQ